LVHGGLAIDAEIGLLHHIAAPVEFTPQEREAFLVQGWPAIYAEQSLLNLVSVLVGHGVYWQMDCGSYIEEAPPRLRPCVLGLH
jgi:hypothetical protein